MKPRSALSLFQVLYSLLIAMFFATSSTMAIAEDEANGPTSLVITYKAKPESRAAFRAFMDKQGAAQFAQWKKDGVFQNSRLLFTPYAAASAFDMAVILDFAHFTDLARWKEIEKTMPGGLPAAALALGAPDSSSLADPFVHAQAPGVDPAKASYMVSFYQIVTTRERYQKYVEGYTVPQMKGWIDAGVLTGYSMYLNQGVNPTWGALLVMEYKDIDALAQRESVKSGVRQKLGASDPVWKTWSNDKSGIRKEVSLNLADAIVPQDQK